jgi:pimeloyl-ACP methyl ester carboxylesterase
LLIMGLDFQMVWWPDGFCERLVEAGFAVVRFDNRDTGLSTHFDSPRRESPWRALLGGVRPVYTGADMVADAVAVMDAVGWRSAHVMGLSMGAALAQSMALLHPSRVRSVVSGLGGPATAGPLRTLSYIRFGLFKEFRKLPPATTDEQEIENLVSIARLVSGPGYPFDERWARRTAEISHARAPRDPRTTQRHLAAGRATRVPPLSAIRVPVLCFSGEADPLFKAAAGRAVARQIPGAVFVGYPGMGHSLPEALWPDIVARVKALTAAPAPPDPRGRARTT